MTEGLFSGDEHGTDGAGVSGIETREELAVAGIDVDHAKVARRAVLRNVDIAGVQVDEDAGGIEDIAAVPDELAFHLQTFEIDDIVLAARLVGVALRIDDQRFVGTGRCDLRLLDGRDLDDRIGVADDLEQRGLRPAGDTI